MPSPASWFDGQCLDEPTWFGEVVRDEAWFDELLVGSDTPASVNFTTLVGRGGAAGVGGVMVGPGGGLAG